MGLFFIKENLFNCISCLHMDAIKFSLEEFHSHFPRSPTHCTDIYLKIGKLNLNGC